MLPQHLFLISTLYFVVGEPSQHGEKDKLLSRKRRYLIFPDGSSLQLVYDQIIGMEDFNNLWIIGVTVALAWELPDSPHIPQHHHHDEHEGQNKTRIYQRRKHVKTHGNQTEAPFNQPQYNSKDFDYFAYYNHQNYHNHQMQHEKRDFLLNQIKKLRSKSDFRNFIPLERKSHSIYPALRMRRHIEKNWDKNKEKMDLVHPESIEYLKHHRMTRFSLFRSIEKYLNAHGKNGSECISRAICETVQRTNDDLLNSTEKHPESFLKEILRVIFSLPSSKFHTNTMASHHHEQIRYASIHQKYDEALNFGNTDASLDCTERYPGCGYSIWSDDFWF